ncbi:hypothetical protein Trydic_g5284 [Trypoxylus dichotomus]
MVSRRPTLTCTTVAATSIDRGGGNSARVCVCARGGDSGQGRYGGANARSFRWWAIEERRRARGGGNFDGGQSARGRNEERGAMRGGVGRNRKTKGVGERQVGSNRLCTAKDEGGKGKGKSIDDGGGGGGDGCIGSGVDKTPSIRTAADASRPTP